MPRGRKLFFKKQRLPIADAHYAMGFAFLASMKSDADHYARAVHFLEILEQTRCPSYKHYCWGYPFHWETRYGTIQAGTPLITTTPYVYEAYHQVYMLDGDKKWLKILRSIVDHVVEDIRDYPTGKDSATCSYTPYDTGGVVNANAYRAYLLYHAAAKLDIGRGLDPAMKNLNFVLEAQQDDGSWLYATDGIGDFVDHFHTCFVLKALAKISKLGSVPGLDSAIRAGLEYYRESLFDEKGLPRPFSRRPRVTVYRHELYDYAECLNLCHLLEEQYPELRDVRKRVVEDVLSNWIKPDGSFRSRRLLLGWDNIPMHRWAQSQMFRSLALIASEPQCKDSSRS